MSFKLDNICKSYGDTIIFREFCMELEEGVISCILGPSGCGKTTLLNMIGAITKPDSGTLHGFSGKKFSYIFQEPRLLPWKSVRGNIEFVLDGKFSARERRENADKLINMVELNGFANFYPSQLSGGMKQRVSIARAFATCSDVILMDEPLTGLNQTEAVNTLDIFRKIRDQLKCSILLVEHNMKAVMQICERIVVLHHGQLLATGTPTEIRSNQDVVNAYLGAKHAH